jgi:hypothetical protein
LGIRNLKPVTPGSRFASRSDFADLTAHKPEKKLTVALRKKGGRNNTGNIEAVVISVDIELSITKEINLVSMVRWLLLSMIQIVLPIFL